MQRRKIRKIHVEKESTHGKQNKAKFKKQSSLVAAKVLIIWQLYRESRKRKEKNRNREQAGADQVSPRNDNKELSNITQITAVTKQMIGNTSKDMAP